MTYYINVYPPTAQGTSDLGVNCLSAAESDMRAAANERLFGGRRIYRLRVHLK